MDVRHWLLILLCAFMPLAYADEAPGKVMLAS